MNILRLLARAVVPAVVLMVSFPCGTWGVSAPEFPTSIGSVPSVAQVGQPKMQPAEWAEFLGVHGGAWAAKWDLVRNVPVILHGSGYRPLDQHAHTSADALSIARAFLHQNKTLIGVEDIEGLDILRAERAGKTWYVSFGQTISGAPVLWGGVDVRVWKDGRVYAVRSRLIDQSAAKASWTIGEYSAGELALLELGSLADGAEVAGVERVFLRAISPVSAYRVRVKRTAPALDWDVLVDGESGEVIFGYSNIRYINEDGTPFEGLGIECQVSLEQLPQFYSELPVTVPSRWEQITIESYGSPYTDATGYLSAEAGYPLDTNISTRLQGKYIKLINAGGAFAHIDSVAHSRGVTRLSWSDAGARPDEMNCYHHGNLIHDFVLDTLGYDGMDFQMPCTIGVTGYENAYWDGTGMTYGAGASRYRNFALFSDVIYHEYTHGTTDHIYRPFGLPYIGESGAIDEGVADYFAATITDDPEIGNGGLVIAGALNFRNMDNDLVWPDNRVGEVHGDGEILGGALWDFRKYAGRVVADSVFHLARFDWPQNFEEFFYAALLSDDDNGNLADGTPHDAAIFVAFGDHGFAPNPNEQVSIRHTELHDFEDTLRAYPINAEILSGVGIDTSAVYVSYSTGGEFTFVGMRSTGVPNEYAAQIPPQQRGTEVHYYLSVGLESVPIFYTDPPDAPIDFYSFRVLRDTIAPVVEHDPHTNIPYDFWPLSLYAEVTDNLGVGEVFVEYRCESSADTAWAANSTGSSYAATLSGQLNIGDTLCYRIVARDSSEAKNSTVLPEEGWFTTSLGLGFFEDVEGDVSAWTHYSRTEDFGDAWITSSAFNHTTSGLTSWLCLGTDPSGHSVKVDAALVPPAFHLAGGSLLSFWHRVSVDTQNDFVAWNGAVVEISRDAGATWQVIEPIGGYPYELLNDLNPLHGAAGCFSGESAGWELVEFDLSTFSGDVLISFRMALDGYGDGELWAIDDINLFAGEPVAVNRTDRALVSASPELLQTYPNPFNPTVAIRFRLPAKAECRVSVHDLKGRLVREIFSGEIDAGVHTIRWNALDTLNRPAGSGVYFVRFATDDIVRTRKVLLLK